MAVNFLVVRQSNAAPVLQGSVNTSLETLHQLASGSTDLCKLKKQLKVSVANSEDSQAALTHQVRHRGRKE